MIPLCALICLNKLRFNVFTYLMIQHTAGAVTDMVPNIDSM